MKSNENSPRDHFEHLTNEREDEKIDPSNRLGIANRHKRLGQCLLHDSVYAESILSYENAARGESETDGSNSFAGAFKTFDGSVANERAARRAVDHDASIH